MSLVKSAFPRYDDTLPVIEGFSDYSYKNDTCPCIGKEVNKDEYIMVYCDYKNPNKSESYTGGDYYRFFVMLDLTMDENQNNPKLLGLFKTKNEVKKFLKSHTIEQLKTMEDMYG
jgi:hypothetical protein